jgi:hypothetical protein
LCVMFLRGIASVHLVKLVATITKQRHLVDGGCILPMKSNPQPLNGQGLIIGCNIAAGTN